MDDEKKEMDKFIVKNVSRLGALIYSDPTQDEIDRLIKEIFDTEKEILRDEVYRKVAFGPGGWGLLKKAKAKKQ